MCRALPARVERISGDMAWLEGQAAPVLLIGVDGVAVGDYVIHHAGLVLSRLDPAEAQAIAMAFDELDALLTTEQP
ncbi:MAG: HypC/HybG/HupF family hydrogenase formation chaperone [Chloroflexi bacterium]|nr:HypC/HybG/HupF family hydrogenase formation chaperone [Chloroflexota bacterium]